MFKSKNKPKQDELKLLKERIFKLEKDIARKPSDDINEARYALSKCTEYKNKCINTEKEVNDFKIGVKNKLESVNNYFQEIENYKLNISKINDLSSNTEDKINNLIKTIEHFESIYENNEELNNNLKELGLIYESGSDLSNKINALYTNIKKQKSEIEVLSYEIFGYSEYDEEKEKDIHYKGLKDKLEESYSDISANLEELDETIDKLNDSTKLSLKNIENETQSNYSKFIIEKDARVTKLIKEIEDLLPRALTAGLSHAYQQKRENEINEGKSLSKTFNYAIAGLVIVSLIPFAVSLYLLLQGDTLQTVINNMPRMVLSILPLYTPIVWLAYSSNKKINLSKRLVEEYTHKEVLSKTFEGLSKQIEELPDNNISEELRAKLLFNILSVNSENPGKLISDYNRADHPLMDALEKSAKLSDAVETISKIPGLTKLSSILEKKANETNRIQNEKIDKGLREMFPQTKEETKEEKKEETA